MSKLILATTSDVIELLRGGRRCPVMNDNRSLQWTMAPVGRLAALAWRLDPVIIGTGDDTMLRAAAHLMCIPNAGKKIRAACGYDWILGEPLRAQPGDIIVALPRTEDLVAVRDVASAKRYLAANQVYVFHVGAPMAKDIQAAYEQLDWNTLTLPVARDVGTIVEENPDMMLTAFDVIRAKGSTKEAKWWLDLFMKGRAEKPLREFKFDRLTSVSVEFVLDHKFRNMGFRPEQYTEQTKAFANEFGLRNGS